MKVARVVLQLIVCLLVTISIGAGGFEENTPVKMINGYQVISTVQPGDRACVSNEDEAWVISVRKTKVPRYVALRMNGICVRMALCQKILCSNGWKEACNITPGDRLCCAGNKQCIVDDVCVIEKELEMYELALDKDHVFLVSEHEIYAHNFSLLLLVWVLHLVAVASHLQALPLRQVDLQ